MIFFSARQTYSGFFHKPPNQKQTQPDWVTCENKFWWQGDWWLVVALKRNLCLYSGPIFQKKYNLCCVTKKKKKKKFKEQDWKKQKHFHHSIRKTERAWWKEMEQERQYLTEILSFCQHKSGQKTIKYTILHSSVILHVDLCQLYTMDIVQNFPNTESIE